MLTLHLQKFLIPTVRQKRKEDGGEENKKKKNINKKKFTIFYVTKTIVIGCKVDSLPNSTQ